MHERALPVDRIKAIFEKRLGILVPGVESDLFAAGTLDSLSFINLLLHLESEFGISIPLEKLDLGQFSTVNSIAVYVCEMQGENAEYRSRLASSAG
ncbi:MAG: acyl carrier protein [Gammaproteobacteria bacterium]